MVASEINHYYLGGKNMKKELMKRFTAVVMSVALVVASVSSATWANEYPCDEDCGQIVIMQPFYYRCPDGEPPTIVIRP